MPTLRRAFLAGFLTLAPLPALAECPQEKAIYRDQSGIFEITFTPIYSASTHLFKLKIQNTDVMLDGFVMDSDPGGHSNAIIQHNCPEGDVTGEDIAACTIWEGVIHPQPATNDDILPPMGTLAAHEILLTGFGSALRQSSITQAASGDRFKLTGCNS